MMPASPRILLVGQGTTTLSALEALAERFEIIGLVRELPPETPADAPTLRAREAGISVYPDSSLGAIEALVAHLKPDCVVISSHSRIFPPELLSKSRFVNVH